MSPENKVGMILAGRTRPVSFPWFAILAIASALAVPLVFVGVLYVWAEIDKSVASREVSQYIRDHQSILSKRLTNPKVHSFSVTHHPSAPGTLVIQFDVDDKATFELLESDLNDSLDMQFPPHWETNIRSKEKLSDNLSYAAWGMGEAAKALERLGIAAIVSVAPLARFALLALWHVYKSCRVHPAGRKMTEQ
jgi:hypothetical protein